MRYVAVISGGLLLFGIVASSEVSAQTAKAELRNVRGAAVGTATLTEGPNGVKIALQLSNLPPGTHGFHIHAVGKCDPPDFNSAGAHFNPEERKHGGRTAEGPHAGDLANLVVGIEGTVKLEIPAPRVTLGPGKYSLFSPAGTTLVIHAGLDDELTDPTGNSGARIACGVITR